MDLSRRRNDIPMPIPRNGIQGQTGDISPNMRAPEFSSAKALNALDLHLKAGLEQMKRRDPQRYQMGLDRAVKQAKSVMGQAKKPETNSVMDRFWHSLARPLDEARASNPNRSSSVVSRPALDTAGRAGKPVSPDSEKRAASFPPFRGSNGKSVPMTGAQLEQLESLIHDRRNLTTGDVLDEQFAAIKQGRIYPHASLYAAPPASKRQKIGNWIYEFYKERGMPRKAYLHRDMFHDVTGIAPVVDTALSADEMGRDFALGRYGPAAVGAAATIGALFPGYGAGIAKAIRSHGKKLLRAIPGGGSILDLPVEAVESTAMRKKQLGRRSPGSAPGGQIIEHHQSAERIGGLKLLKQPQMSLKTYYGGKMPERDEFGKIKFTPEGVKLEARRIVGRSNSGPERNLSLKELKKVVNSLTQRPISRVPITGRDLKGENYGLTRSFRNEKLSRRVFLDETLRDKQQEKVLAHEFGHVARHATKRFPREDGFPALPEELKSEFAKMYSDLNPEPGPGLGHNWLPFKLRYKPAEREEEFFAEAVRAYVMQPNEFKQKYPEIARYIRKTINSEPTLKKVIQFNSVAGGALLGHSAINGSSSTAGNDGED